jgi:putative membrane protein
MHRSLLQAFVVIGVTPLLWSGVAVAIQNESAMEQSFLQQAAEGQQAEIALGKLAKQKASSEQVREFGERMIQDHQKASNEVQQLASKEGIQVSPKLNEKHKHKQQDFARLSGKAFDRAYMEYMLRDHAKEVNEFEQNAKLLKDPQVKTWASATLPILKEHLQKAEMVASAIGMDVNR